MPFPFTFPFTFDDYTGIKFQLEAEVHQLYELEPEVHQQYDLEPIVEND